MAGIILKRDGSVFLHEQRKNQRSCGNKRTVIINEATLLIRKSTLFMHIYLSKEVEKTEEQRLGTTAVRECGGRFRSRTQQSHMNHTKSNFVIPC